jgi:hypothetical protein
MGVVNLPLTALNLAMTRAGYAAGSARRGLGVPTIHLNVVCVPPPAGAVLAPTVPVPGSDRARNAGSSWAGWTAARVLAVACALDLRADLPLAIWHGGGPAARRLAALFEAVIAAPSLPGEPAIRCVSELAPPRTGAAGPGDGPCAAAGRQVLRLRDRLTALPPCNVLWLAPGPLLPFLYLTFVRGVAPGAWAPADVEAWVADGPRDGFAHRLPAGAERTPAAPPPYRCLRLRTIAGRGSGDRAS